jgi:DNA-binding winged helix-turn-helix (wHTH) protein/tetratricopeptide (TPR) repeat protein
MNTIPQQAPLWIGDYRLDPAAQRLWRDGQPVDLLPQVWALLMCLVQHAGQLLTKDEILKAAWPGVAVSDMALSQAVRRLRTAFGDDARQPRYIETVHRRGFRLIAAVRDNAVESVAVDTPAEERPLFVGRETELRRLAELLRAARSGARRIVFIEGEAGIGKTALLNSFLAEHVGADARVATAQCVEQQGSVEPYLSVFEALDRLARSHADALNALRRYGPTWLVQMPWLLGPDEMQGLERSITDATRARMLREMGHALEALSSERLLVLLLEDLHWADPATLDLLGSIAQRTAPAQLLILCTYQPGRAIAFGHPIIDLARRLSARGACKRLSLEPFGPADVQAFLARRFSSPDGAASLAERFYLRSEGNPLFLVTMVGHLIQRGLLPAGPAPGGLGDDIGDKDLNDIPPNLREMIELHLDSVSAAELETLEAASAAALEFRTAAVAAALGMTGPEGIDAVEHRCERLAERWHLLREAGAESWPDGTRTSRYAFRHDLYRQVLYERLPGGRRRRFHQRIGECLEHAFADTLSRVAAELAGHFDRSGDTPRAATYFIQAAGQARRRFAEREAADHFRAALRHLDELPPAGGRDLQELQALLGLVRTSLMTELERPREEARNVSRIEMLATRITDGPDLFRFQLSLAQIHILRSLPVLAEPITDRLVGLAEHGTPGQQMEAHLARGSAAVMRGHFATAAEDVTRALAIYGDGDPPAAAGFAGYAQKWREIGTRIHSVLGATLLLLGAPDRALAHLQRTIDLCEGRLHPNYVAGRLLSVAGVLCLRGDLELARAVSDRGFGLAEEHQFTSMIAMAAPQRLWLALKRGDSENVGARTRAAWENYLRARDSSAALVAPLFLIDACRIAGAVDEGLAMVQRIWEDMRPAGLRWDDAELQRLKGELILLQGKRDARAEAAACFRRALDIANEQGGRFYELRAATSLAWLWRGRRDEGAAREALERVYAGFTEGFETPDLRAAAACLGSERPHADASGLRAAEVKQGATESHMLALRSRQQCL